VSQGRAERPDSSGVGAVAVAVAGGQIHLRWNVVTVPSRWSFWVSCPVCETCVATHWIGYDRFVGARAYVLSVLPPNVVDLRRPGGALKTYGLPSRMLRNRSRRSHGADPGGGQGALDIDQSAEIRESLARCGLSLRRVRSLVTRAPFVTHCPSCRKRISVEIPPLDCDVDPPNRGTHQPCRMTSATGDSCLAKR
jgi:hypothetical protein